MKKRQHWNTSEAIVELVKRLVRIPSISGTLEEKDMADELTAILMEIPYFQKHQTNIFREKIVGDSLEREAVAALLKGKDPADRRTLILLSHYDVVGVDDCGHFQEFAFDPDAYLEKLKEETSDPLLQKELDSGEWLFGRGSMDMKAGIALHLALLSEWAAREDSFKGNILFLSTPDEERNSEGMLAAVNLLLRLKEQEGLDYSFAICSEPSFSNYPGDESKYIYAGSVGKMLPLVFCSGKETHAGEPLEGVNASWMAAVFTAQMELSPEFADRARGEQGPLPICLKLTDLKDRYNVQTPTYAYGLYNIMTLKQTPDETMKRLVKKAEDSAEEIHSRLKAVYAAGGVASQPPKPRVYTYSSLYELGVERYGDRFKEDMENLFLKWTDVEFDYRELTVELAKEMAGYFTDLAPFYLVMLAPPYYPHVSLNKENQKEDFLLRLTETIQAKALHDYQTEIKLQQFFMGLSDVSYCRLMDGDKVIGAIEAEMPLYNRRYHLPLEQIAKLDIPTVNIGPYGKDAHKRTERLELPFSTGILPDLLRHAVEKWQEGKE
ncbi:M20/M25/M40 family metallo-hydrolase [Bacillus massiliglaciei]|uniref:M20/M25/M40 family metallo-hydrolase n=1 Tax=Bacillus massiliglaciei TaxID=1816693 RepID=UPI000B1B1F75|nr:M20/M25/M40 family metallo-hydrolase [Bacillus massiliglaciei]